MHRFHLLKQFDRKKEEPYTWCNWIGESWNTLTNLPFVLIGLYRLSANDPVDQPFYLLYWLYIFAGLCSAFHHACAHLPNNKWSIWIDWFPIAASIILFMNQIGLTVLLTNDLVSVYTWTTLGCAFFALLSDHLFTPLPVPIGHCLWHLLAALSIDSLYQDLIINC